MLTFFQLNCKLTADGVSLQKMSVSKKIDCGPCKWDKCCKSMIFEVYIGGNGMTKLKEMLDNV